MGIKNWDVFSKDIKCLKLDEEYHLILNMPVSDSDFGAKVKYEFHSKVKELSIEGKIHVHVKLLRDGIIYIMYCIHEGDRGDIDGYGVEPDVWVTSLLDFNGKLLIPLDLYDDNEEKEFIKQFGSFNSIK